MKSASRDLGRPALLPRRLSFFRSLKFDLQDPSSGSGAAAAQALRKRGARVGATPTFPTVESRQTARSRAGRSDSLSRPCVRGSRPVRHRDAASRTTHWPKGARPYKNGHFHRPEGAWNPIPPATSVTRVESDARPDGRPLHRTSSGHLLAGNAAAAATKPCPPAPRRTAKRPGVRPVTRRLRERRRRSRGPRGVGFRFPRATSSAVPAGGLYHQTKGKEAASCSSARFKFP